MKDLLEEKLNYIGVVKLEEEFHEVLRLRPYQKGLTIESKIEVTTSYGRNFGKNTKVKETEGCKEIYIWNNRN